MVQSIFDKSPIRKQLIINPKTKNKVLYELSNAITNNQKTIVRKLKAKILKGTIPLNNNFSTEHLTSEDLEKRIIQALNAQPNNANLLGKAIDFFIKVRDKKDVMEEELNMEGYLKLGISAASDK